MTAMLAERYLQPCRPWSRQRRTMAEQAVTALRPLDGERDE
jgi:hypothetical protein